MMKSRRPAFLLVLALAMAARAWAFEPASVTKISWVTSAMTEIISPGGVRVLIDVYKPKQLSAPAADTDILLTTHWHYDHYNMPFKKAFKGKQLFSAPGAIEQGDVRITGIPASHDDKDIAAPNNASDYIFIIETGGLRIVHTGDLGQPRLTDEQLKAIGEVDVLITQFDNSYSAMSVENRKGFIHVEQLAPKLIIPGHNSDAALAVQKDLYRCVSSPAVFVTLTPERLKADREAAGKPLFLVMGENAAARAALCGAQPVDW
jgi:L-ascorbate metabolism protein UlaG (beta-lactamase superfamily)